MANPRFTRRAGRYVRGIAVLVTKSLLPVGRISIDFSRHRTRNLASPVIATPEGVRYPQEVQGDPSTSVSDPSYQLGRVETRGVT